MKKNQMKKMMMKKKTKMIIFEYYNFKYNISYYNFIFILNIIKKINYL